MHLHPIHGHLMDTALLDRAEAAQNAPSWQPLFLNQRQNEVSSRYQSIVPGSAGTCSASSTCWRRHNQAEKSSLRRLRRSKHRSKTFQTCFPSAKREQQKLGAHESLDGRRTSWRFQSPERLDHHGVLLFRGRYARIRLEWESCLQNFSRMRARIALSRCQTARILANWPGSRAAALSVLTVNSFYQCMVHGRYHRDKTVHLTKDERS
jgi:hypothetical protein